ncbi:MAG TPA: MoxR family ATPase [Patescibacteria group bacterium]|nr:MoxR family ATPase [Patescibacteria group bacterium]
MSIQSINDLQLALRQQNYIADHGLATAIFLALKLKRPLFLEGEAGVGKTEVAKVIAGLKGARLIRLQCYEGLDVNQAVYEWNYTRQMLHIKLMEAHGERSSEEELFGSDYLLRRPLLQAVDFADELPPVLLIDEIDRSDEEFEAFLLEILSDFQITIPEIGTIAASQPPTVVLTSNRTREVHDALKRRCLYYWIDYPTFEKELEIVHAKVPEAPVVLAQQVTAFIQELRLIELYKIPGVAETLDWIAALLALDQQALEPKIVDDTLGVILKYQDDVNSIKGKTTRRIVEKVGGIK